MFNYARNNINKWLNNNIQLHFIMKHFNMTQWRVLCPQNHVLKTTTTTGDILELSSPLVDQSARCPVSKLAIREMAYLRVVRLPADFLCNKHVRLIYYIIFCPHYHIIKTKTTSTTAGGIRELSSPWDVQSMSWHIRELSSYRSEKLSHHLSNFRRLVDTVFKLHTKMQE